MNSLYVYDARCETALTAVIPAEFIRMRVDESMPVTSFLTMFDSVLGGVPEQRFRRLDIYCHGGITTGRIRLELFQEGLDIGNVHLLSRLNGKVRRIKIWSCNAADPSAGGHEFCRELARITNATVVASPELQWGRPHSINHFEGRVSVFSPDPLVPVRTRILPPGVRDEHIGDPSVGDTDDDVRGPLIPVPR